MSKPSTSISFATRRLMAQSTAQFSCILASQAGVATSAGAAAVGPAGAAAGACAFDEWNVGALNTMPNSTATTRAVNPARKGSLHVIVFMRLFRS
jgi:hypothetical protein